MENQFPRGLRLCVLTDGVWNVTSYPTYEAVVSALNVPLERVKEETDEDNKIYLTQLPDKSFRLRSLVRKEVKEAWVAECKAYVASDHGYKDGFNAGLLFALEMFPMGIPTMLDD
jgi:hypothetical protein